MKTKMRAGERKSIARFHEHFSGPRQLSAIAYRFIGAILPIALVMLLGFAAYAESHNGHHGVSLAMAATAVVVPGNIKALQQKKIDLTKKQRALLDKAKADNNRNLTAEEDAEFEANVTALQGVEKSIQREEKQLEAERALGTVTNDDETETVVEIVKPSKFKTFGEQLLAVIKASKSDGRNVDPRLLQAGPSGLSEAVPADGGFLVQTDFSEKLLTRTYELGQVAQRVTRIPLGANSNGVKINAVDEDSRANGSRWGGVQAFWANEADAFTASKPKFRQIELKLQKLIGLCYATDELLSDAVALGGVISEAFPQEFTFKVEDAIINGTGAGQPLGLLNSGAVIQVAKDAADSSATISTNDVLAMWKRCWGRSRLNAVWLINQDVESALLPLTLGTGTAVQLMYTPPGGRGNEGGQYGLLMGRPVIPVEYCATLGTPGDIILGDLSQYIMSDKGAPEAASSIHVRFLNDETTFRFTYRVDGQPTWKKPLTPKNGTNTLSPFVDLATRP